ncbi:MAG: hypothetical protein K9M57_00775 [Phycisphaerae bacterium]|nr:hypothetical protein [Phycisphaerae bacterium]
MDWIYEILQSESGRHLFNALLHTLWQGAVLAGVLWVILKTVGVKAAGLRYNISVVMLLLMVVCGFVTWAALGYDWQAVEVPGGDVAWPLDGVDAAVGGVPSGVDSVLGSDRSISVANNATGKIDYYAIGFGLWCLGAFVMVLRAVVKVARASRFSIDCCEVGDSAILTSVENLRCRMGISRRIRVFASERLSVPAVIGVFYPVLFLPVTAISGIPAEQVNAMIAHELAHIRRYDYLVNCLQMLFEAILFFNPAVWWVSRQIRIEREACCDDRAVTATGEPISYARALVDWAERLQGGTHTGTAVPMAGFSGNSKNNGLIDRVKRLVVTDHKPLIKMNWLAIGGMLVVSCVVLVALRVGTNEAVGYVGELLSDEERIEKIVEIKEEYRPIRTSEYGEYSKEDSEKDKITVKGMVKTWDGKPLPSDWRVLSGRSIRPSYYASYSVNLKNGHFEQKMHYGKVYLTAAKEGYAPAIAGPLETGPGGVIEGVVLVLGKGFDTNVKVVGKDGESVVKAKLSAVHTTPGEASATHTDYMEAVTDDSGTAIFSLCTEGEIEIDITAPGYQYNEVKAVLKQGKDIRIPLEPADIASGVVVSDQTGKPIAGATLSLVSSQEGPFWRGSSDPYSKNPMVLATTDAAGRFAVDTLRSDTRHYFRIDADGYGVKFPVGIMAGQKDIKISLGQSLYCAGKITGISPEMVDKNGHMMITYCNPFEYHPDSGGNSYNENFKIAVQDGVAEFKIKGLWPGKFWIYVKNRQEEFDLKAQLGKS